MKLRPAILLFALLVPLSSWGAPAKPRPAAGVGLVIIRPLSPPRYADISSVTLYREPGVGRVGTLATKGLPGLAQVIAGGDRGDFVLAVLAKKGDWLRVAYDDAGHEAWLALARPWHYLSWEAFLRGKRARLLPGLQKEYYLLRTGPAPSSREAATLTRNTPFRVVKIRDEWALVARSATLSGWLRWRDGDGRLLITLDEGAGTESR